MELSPQLARLLREDLIILEGPALNRPPLIHTPELANLIDHVGCRSAIAQGLKGPNNRPVPVTASYKLANSTERLYMLAHGDSPRLLVGILKMGRKNLFHYDSKGTIHQLQEQHSVLDFYVHESFQRQGVGLTLFQAMLDYEDTSPEMLAYDRPSPKLIVRRCRSHSLSSFSCSDHSCLYAQGFLRKHFHLSDYVPQQNNFVIFNRFFEMRAPPKQSAYDSISSRPLTARNGRKRFQ
ncbi:MAG: hypothetical protein SGPRY_006800 [Prymnesium sp.]